MKRVDGKQIPQLVLCAILIMVMVSPIFGGRASAAQITLRSLTLQSGTVDSDSDGINDGGSQPGGVVNHRFDFTVPSNTDIGSILFQYCTTASGTCTMPTGLATNSAATALGAEDTDIGGFTLIKTTNGAPYLTRTASSPATTNTATFYRLDNVTNPSATNQTFFVRISTFASTNTTGSPTDTGTVTASTATQIQLTGTMPESLIFCTGATIGTSGLIPDCTTATAGTISFDQLFSPTDTATATSQMAASTNAGFGYAITVNGPTLTSGSNTIARMTNGGTGPADIALGTGQFGMNLINNVTTLDNQTPTPQPLGAAVAPVSNGTNLRGQPTTDYASQDDFEFTTGDTIARSDFGGANGTDAQIFTASYVVNVPGSQPAGTYTTTLTYICTPTF